MGAMGTVMLGMGAVGAATQIIGGMQQKKEAEMNASAVMGEANYNAGIYRAQAGLVEQQKRLKAQQDARKIRFIAGQHVATAAAKGIEMSGSPMAILEDTLTQLEMDKAISSYNYDMEKYSLESQARASEYRGMTLASQYRRSGGNAMMAGLVGGLTTFAGAALKASAYSYTPGRKPDIITTGNTMNSIRTGFTGMGAV